MIFNFDPQIWLRHGCLNILKQLNQKYDYWWRLAAHKKIELEKEECFCLCGNAALILLWLREGLWELACRWTCAMFKLMRVLVLAVALAVSLRLPHGSQYIGSLSPATTCKLPRDLTSLVWHNELAERREAVNLLYMDPWVAIASWLLFSCVYATHKNNAFPIATTQNCCKTG